jgi:SOS response regulatory protein OraA/RecX
MSQVTSYIKKNLKKGYTQEALRWALVNQGHSKLEIEKAFQKVEEELALTAPVLKTKPKITYSIHTDQDTSQVDLKKKPFWKRWFD